MGTLIKKTFSVSPLKIIILVIFLSLTMYIMKVPYITEEREKKKIRGAFQYYLTASVITEMLKDPQS